MAAANATSIIFTWTAPFTLDVTGVDPDIWYSVSIYNVTDDLSATAFSCTDCIRVTEPLYVFTPEDPSPCIQYYFAVVPFNGAGMGEASQNITGYTIDGEQLSH